MSNDLVKYDGYFSVRCAFESKATYFDDILNKHSKALVDALNRICSGYTVPCIILASSPRLTYEKWSLDNQNPGKIWSREIRIDGETTGGVEISREYGAPVNCTYIMKYQYKQFYTSYAYSKINININYPYRWFGDLNRSVAFRNASPKTNDYLKHYHIIENDPLKLYNWQIQRAGGFVTWKAKTTSLSNAVNLNWMINSTQNNISSLVSVNES